MRFHPERCARNHFEDHVLRLENEYDYVWCAADVDVHTHEDFYELFILAGGDFYHYCDGEERRIGRNTVYFFKPGESHGIFRATPARTSRNLCLPLPNRSISFPFTANINTLKNIATLPFRWECTRKT